MSGPLQVEFFFTGVPLNEPGTGARTDYAGFNLNGVEYKIGDCAFLFPEDEAVPPFIGRILSVFHDPNRNDPHCVEVAWYERRAHLEPADTHCPDWEREVVALQETDINPIGCISGKAIVLKAGGYEEACLVANMLESTDWLFCRGVYKQDENCIVPYPELAEHQEMSNGKRAGKRSQPGISGQAEVVADSDDVKRRRFAEELPAAPVRRTGKLVSGRTCVECGATQTPQWREGPAGPKTLCNACGVRYVRAQQRANKRTVPSGGSRGSSGSGGRQARAAKAARAEAAAARSARAAAAQEAPQRPLRQAALMAASKTAQYARTGVFPQSVTELQTPLYDTASGAGNGADVAAMRAHHAQDRLAAEAPAGFSGAAEHAASGATDVVRSAAFEAAAAAAAAAAAQLMAQGRPGTPNCSSYDSSGSLPEGCGMTVEVVVGTADGDGECGVVPRGGAGMDFAAAFPALLPAAAAATASQAPLPLPPQGPAALATGLPGAALLGGAVFVPQASCMVPTDSGGAAVSPAAMMAHGSLPQLPLPQRQHQQMEAPASGGLQLLRVPPGGGCAFFRAGSGAASDTGLAVAAARRRSTAGGSSGGAAAQLCEGMGDGLAAAVDGALAGCGPALSGNFVVMAQGSGVDCGGATASGVESPAATTTTVGVVPQVLSAPVSPSARSSFGGCNEAAMMQQQQVAYGESGEEGTAGVGLVDDNMQRMYGGMYGESLGGCCLDDEYGPLVEVEVDFGLGPASALGSGALFDEEFPDSAMGNPDTDDMQLPYPLTLTRQQQQQLLQHSHTCGAAAARSCPPCNSNADAGASSGTAAATAADDVDARDDGFAHVRSVADLPAVAAVAAAFCPELAPGEDARRLLDEIPTLAQKQQQASAHGQVIAGDSAIGAGAAADGGSGRAPVSAFAAAAGVPASAEGADAEERGVAGSLPGEAMAQLLSLGRRASQASMDALAADAALQAASQVLEAHQEAARRAHEAAVSNLELLQDCITNLASANSASSCAADSQPSASLAPAQAAGAGAGNGFSNGGGGVHLIDLRDLTCLGVGFGGLPGCCGFDAGELVVAVHS